MGNTFQHKAESSEDVGGIVREESDIRTIYLIGSIDSGLLSGFLPVLHSLDASRGPITVVLASDGGDVEVGWAIYDAIRGAKNRVTIDGYGNVYSAAVLILQAGDLRRLTKNCRVMLHNGSVDLGSRDSRQVAAAALAYDQETDMYIQELALRSGLPRDRVKDMCDQETYLLAKEAVDLGLADRVIPYPKKRTK